MGSNPTLEHKRRDDRWRLSYAESWAADTQSYPRSPVLPLTRPSADYPSASIKRFIEHLLPEGRALDVAVAYNGLTQTNVFGLIWALGAETAGALRFTGDAAAAQVAGEPVLREIPWPELNQRIAEREQVPLTVWDGRVRMSVAGLQDKLRVDLDRPLNQSARIFLVDGQRLASTHILKPDTANPNTPHLAVNEHFCMSLARGMGLPAAEMGSLRPPGPVLVVRRFDREVENTGGLLEPTPWYDLVSVLQYDGFDTELAMAYGDVFKHAEVLPLAMADFAVRCGIDRKLLRREGQRLAKLAEAAALAQAEDAAHEGGAERAFVRGIARFVAQQAQRLTHLVAEAARLKAECLGAR